MDVLSVRQNRVCPCQSRATKEVDYIAMTLEAPKAEALLNELDRAVRQIVEFPHSCELYRTDRPMKNKIRKLHVKGYALYYAMFKDKSEIRRFLHSRKNRSELAFSPY